MECTIWIPCRCLPFFKVKNNKIVNNNKRNNNKPNYKYISIFDNNIERN